MKLRVVNPWLVEIDETVPVIVTGELTITAVNAAQSSSRSTKAIVNESILVCFAIAVGMRLTYLSSMNPRYAARLSIER